MKRSIRTISCSSLAALLAACAAHMPIERAIPAYPVDASHAVADVSVSDGSQFRVETTYDGRGGSYRATYPERTLHYTTDGSIAVSRTSDGDHSLPDGFALWILGHQFHAQLLDFASLNNGIASVSPCTSISDDCREQFGNRSAPDIGIERLSLRRDMDTGRPHSLVIHRKDNVPVVSTFGDWRQDNGMNVPYIVEIDDGERRFVYRFTELSINDWSGGQ